jgi:flagellar assembly protein FliH
MAARAKFLFDVDFGAGAAAAAVQHAVALGVHEAALADARARAYGEGYAAAEAKAAADLALRLATALEQAAAGLDRMNRGLRAIEARLECESAEVAVMVARKLAPELVAREPFAEIAALAAECFSHLVATPHVVVRVNEALYAEARERLAAIAQTRGFGGRLVVLAEPGIAPGDCRIEWADGGLVRDRATTEAAIGEAVGRYVAARRPPPETKQDNRKV